MLNSLYDLFKSIWNQILKLLGFGSGNAISSPDEEISKMLSICINTNYGEKIFLQLDPDWCVGRVKEELSLQLGDQGDQQIKLIFAGKELPDSLILNQCDLGQNSILHAVRIVAASPSNTKKDCDAPREAKTNDSSIPINDLPLKDGRSNSKSKEELLDLAQTEGETNEVEDDARPSQERAQAPQCSLLCDASTVITIQLTREEQEQLKQIKEASGAVERPHFYVYCVRPCAGIRIGKLRVRCAACKAGAVTLQSDPTCWQDVLKHTAIACNCANEGCSSESFAEFYFKCGSHVTAGEDDTAVPLYLIRANLPRVACLSCGDISTPVFVFQCEASHVLCLDCFITYSLSKLSERQFTYDQRLGYTLPCPVNCLDSLIEEVHHFRLLGELQYARYQRWATEEAVFAVGGVLCPRPGCGHGIIPDADCDRITCVGGCGFTFCRRCLMEYHTGACWRPGVDDPPLSAGGGRGFNVDRAVASKSMGWDVASAAAIQTLTKPCPKCRTPTERSGGCMHMVCTRASCRHNWCWVCHTEWTRDCMASHWFG